MSENLPENISKLNNMVVKELLHAVKRLQNGDISRIMNRLGLLYRYNYGVSIPQLRQIAMKYEPNKEVANLLFQQDIREAKILASILNEPDCLTPDEALEIGFSLNNQELIEQFSRNVFSKLDFLADLLKDWQTDDKWNKVLCFYSVGWYFKQCESESSILLDWVESQIQVEAATDEILVQQAIVFAIQSIACSSDENKAKMTALAEQMMTSEEKSVRRISEDFMWLNAV